MHKFVLTLVLALLTPVTAGAATFYVDKSHPRASDANPGTEALPWETIRYLPDDLEAGDTVRIKSGVYNGGIVFRDSGRPNARIVVEAYPGHQPTITGGVTIRNASFITLRGLKATGRGFTVTGPGVEGIIIDGNYFVDVEASGVKVEGVPWRDTPRGYDWLGAVDIVISNNTMERVLNSGYNEIITVMNGVDGCEIFGNKIFNGGNSRTGGQSIDLKEGVTNCRIYNNEIFNSQKIAIYLDGGSGKYAWRPPEIRNIEIFNNYLHDNDGVGITLGTEGTGTLENIHVHHNRIQNQERIGISIYLHPNGRGQFQNILVENNDVRRSGQKDIQMNHPTSFSTMVVNNLVDNNGVQKLRSARDFLAENNGPWVADAPLPDPIPDPKPNPVPTCDPACWQAKVDALLVESGMFCTIQVARN